MVRRHTVVSRSSVVCFICYILAAISELICKRDFQVSVSAHVKVTIYTMDEVAGPCSRVRDCHHAHVSCWPALMTMTPRPLHDDRQAS
jgi:hypothetical protein